MKFIIIADNCVTQTTAFDTTIEPASPEEIHRNILAVETGQIFRAFSRGFKMILPGNDIEATIEKYLAKSSPLNPIWCIRTKTSYIFFGVH